MNTLQDLRDTLDQHAGNVRDDAVTARTAAVRGRAVAARRRRAAGIGAAAALAVVGALVLPQLGSNRQPGPTDRTFLGKVAPATLQSLGYTYRFAEGEEQRDGNATLRLRATDVPRLITWASPADDVEVYTTVEGEETVSALTDFDDFAFIGAGESGRWTVRAGGESSAIVVYELDRGAIPAGTTIGDLTFRQRVGDEQLVAAAALPEGEKVLTVRATVPDSERMRVAEFCQGVPSDERLWVNVAINGDGSTASGGCSHDGFDPAVGDATWLDDRHLPEPGEEIEVTMWVARGINGEPIEYAGARLALGLYDVAEPVAVVGGSELPRLMEHDGHLWTFVDSRQVTSGESRVEFANQGSTPLLAVGTYAHSDSVVTMRSTPSWVIDRNAPSLGGSSALGVLGLGDTARVSSRKPLGPRGTMGIAVYERLD